MSDDVCMKTPESDELNRVTRLLMAEWERVERKPVNVSYVATFVDLARAVIADRAGKAVSDKPDPPAQPVHVIDQDGQPYGSVRQCCNRCGSMYVPGMICVTSIAAWRMLPDKTRCSP